MDSAKVVQLIETTILRRGKGTDGDPIRIITQWWTLEGELVVERDAWTEDQKRMANFVALAERQSAQEGK